MSLGTPAAVLIAVLFLIPGLLMRTVAQLCTPYGSAGKPPSLVECLMLSCLNYLLAFFPILPSPDLPGFRGRVFGEDEADATCHWTLRNNNLASGPHGLGLCLRPRWAILGSHKARGRRAHRRAVRPELSVLFGTQAEGYLLGICLRVGRR